MSIVKKNVGMLGLLSLLLAGVMAFGSVSAFAGTVPAKAKTKAAATTKKSTPSKTKKAKKKRRHARRSAVKSVKKS